MQIKIDQSYKRLDKFLFQHFESLPLSLLQRLIRKYKIKINNKKSKANSPLTKGDVVYIYYKFEKRKNISFFKFYFRGKTTMYKETKSMRLFFV